MLKMLYVGFVFVYIYIYIYTYTVVPFIPYLAHELLQRRVFAVWPSQTSLWSQMTPIKRAIKFPNETSSDEPPWNSETNFAVINDVSNFPVDIQLTILGFELKFQPLDPYQLTDFNQAPGVG